MPTTKENLGEVLKILRDLLRADEQMRGKDGRGSPVKTVTTH